MRRTSHRSPRTSITALIAAVPRRANRRSGFRPVLSQLEHRTLLATMMWANPAGGDWDTASNWVNAADPSDQHVPRASDDAVINLTDITVTHDSGTDSVNSITSQDPIAINGGTLTIASASAINSSLADLGGTLGVTGPLTVNGLFTLGANTTLTGSGTVDAYGGLEMGEGGAPNDVVSIQGTTLNNHGAATWDVDGGGLSIADGAAFNNLAGATFTAVGASREFAPSSAGGDGSFNNAGSFIASTAVGTDINLGPTFYNRGTVDLQGGELESDGVTPNTGTFTGAAGTSLVLGTENLAPSSVISSAGTVQLYICTEAGSYSAAGGTLADDTTFTGPVLDLGSSLEVAANQGPSVRFAPAAGGPVTLTTGTLMIDPNATLTGTDSFAVNGMLTLNDESHLSVAGTVAAYGGIELGVGRTLTDVFIDGTTLNNHGAAACGVAGVIGISLDDGAVFNNLAGATFTADVVSSGDGVSGVDIGGDGSFNNAGTLTASTPLGDQVFFSIPFNNAGSVVVQRGELDLGYLASATSTGSFTGAAGTTLNLDLQMLAPSSEICSQGTVGLYACIEAGSYSAAGGTLADDTTFTGPVLDLGSSLEVDEGYENYGGPVSFAPAAGGPVTLTTGTLTIDPYATLTGTDSFAANGMVTLSCGSHLSVTGTVDAYGGLTLNDGPVYIQGTTLNNHDAATWDVGPAASVQLDAGAVINNLAGATFTTLGASSGGIGAGDDSAVAFSNAGIFTASAPIGVTINVPFANTGSIVVQEGDLEVPNISGSGTVTVAPGASFNGSGSLLSPIIVSSGQTLTTTPGETIASGLILAGGTVDVTGPLTVDGMLALGSGSTLTGGGPVDASGGLSIAGNVAISATTLNNPGAATWDLGYASSGSITLSSGATINNLDGATFAIVGNFGGQAIVAGDSSAVAFNNAGTVLYEAGSYYGTTHIQVSFTQATTGTTELDEGSLELDGNATISGSITAVTGTTLTFAGPSNSFDASSSLTSAGTVVLEDTPTMAMAGAYDVTGLTVLYSTDTTFSGPITDLGTDLVVTEATLDIASDQSFTVSDLDMSGSLIGGGGDLTITNSMDWVDFATISGFGTLTIASGASLSLNDGILNGVTLDNAGAATLVSYNSNWLTLENGAELVNEPGASFTIPLGDQIKSDDTATAFLNEGTLTQIGPTSDQTFIQAASFIQTGTGATVLDDGTLEFDGNATIDGSIAAAAGTTLTFAGPSNSFDASSSLTSAGVVVLENTTTVAAAYDVTGTTVVYSSNTTFTAPIADLGTDLEVVDATLDIATDQSFTFNDLYGYGDVLTGGGGDLTVTGSMFWRGRISGFGTLTITSSAALSLWDVTLDSVALDNAGAATLASYSGYALALEDGADLVNEPGASFTILTGGLISSDGTAISFTNEGSLFDPATAVEPTTIQPAFSQTSTGTTVVTDSELSLAGGGSPVTNAGNMTVESGGTLAVSTDYDQSAGSTTLEFGSLDGGNVNITGGSLVGVGTVNGDVWSAATVIPGGTGAAGVLVINGTYAQNASGSLDVDLGGTVAGSQYDQLVVSGSATLAGTLNVGLIDGFEPVLGDAFQVMTFASSAGVFTDYNGMVVGNQLILSPIFNPGNLTLSVLPATTTTTLSPAVPSSVSGQSVTFTATVSVARPATTADPSPTGTVTFYDSGHSIGTGMLSLVGRQDEAMLTTSLLSTASHSITAAYTSGDGNFEPSPVSASIRQVVNPAGTSASVTTSGSPSSPGQTVVFTATVSVVSPGSTAVASPTGTVTFYDSGVAIGTGTLSVVSGQDRATFSTGALAIGSHSITAAYTSGDVNFNPSPMSAAITQVVSGQSIVVLDPTAGGALSLSGNATIKLAGEVVVDSSSSSALSASGNAAVKASVIDVHGGVQKSGNATFSPAPTTGAAVLADPLASLAEPTTTGLTNYGSESVSGNSSATIKPGIYSQISVSGNGTLTLNSGIYIIEGGGFTVSGNASVSGSGVMIFNAGSKYPTTGGTYGGITLSGNGSYNLSPPTTGTYAGIVIFQSRDNSTALTLSGNASGMTGTVYAPAAQLAESGNAQLNAAVIVDTMTISGNGVSNTVALSSPAGTVAYTPAQIRSAYGISALGLDGTGQTIAIVDAYDDPDIDQALDAFDSQFGLTASGPTLYQQYGPASSFLTVLNQFGQATSLPTTDPSGPGTDNWEVEESLDVEWAHAIAPGAQIILVEANSQSLSDLMTGVATAAAQPGVSVVSMSWGFAEGQAVFAADEAAYDRVFNVPGVTFVASTGDYGAADPEYPAYSPNLVAVGGTSLTLNGDGSYNSEAGWGYYSDSVGAFIGSGGGVSLYEPEPAYQTGVQSTGMRTTPDVSLVADPATGAWIADPYNLDPSNPFEVVGGTSLSAPAWAGLVALVNQGRAAAGESTLDSTSPTDTQQALYMLPQSDYNEISSGNNGYAASTGYN